MENKNKQQTLKKLYGSNYYCSICHMYFQDMSGLGRHYHCKKHINNKDKNPTYVELTMETINFIPFECECGVVLTYENRVKHRKGKLHKSNMDVVKPVKKPLTKDDLEVTQIVNTSYMDVVKISIKQPEPVVEEEVKETETVVEEVKQPETVIPKGKVKCECGTVLLKRCLNRHLTTKIHCKKLCKNIIYDIIDNL